VVFALSVSPYSKECDWNALSLLLIHIA